MNLFLLRKGEYKMLIEDRIPDVSLIISVYKNIDFLELVLKSLDYQTLKNFEVIIAEDNIGEEMNKFIKQQKELYHFNLKHVRQEDKGFRKCKILNEAIRASDSDFLVFIDGDCILHKKFIEEYAKRRNDKKCLFGRRVMLGEKITKKLLKTKDLTKLSFFNLLFSDSRHIEEGLYLPFKFRNDYLQIKGCNFGVSKKNMYKINGFDEDYQECTVGEDTDVQRRLETIGIKIVSVKNRAIQYHLFHERKNRDNIHARNKEIYNRKKEAGQYFCKNGLK